MLQTLKSDYLSKTNKSTNLEIENQILKSEIQEFTQSQAKAQSQASGLLAQRNFWEDQCEILKKKMQDAAHGVALRDLRISELEGKLVHKSEYYKQIFLGKDEELEGLRAEREGALDVV